MANALAYVHPSESLRYIFDFTDDLTGDTTLKDIGSGSTITATNFAGTDVSATILASKTRTNMTLLVTIGTLTEGQEYVVTFLGVGNTTSIPIVKTLLVLARAKVHGGM